MILILSEENTNTKVVYSNVLMIEREATFGLHVTMKPIDSISHNKSPYKHFDTRHNNNANNPESDKNTVYFSSITNPKNEDESFDTKYSLRTDEGVLIDDGILLGFRKL